MGHPERSRVARCAHDVVLGTFCILGMGQTYPRKDAMTMQKECCEVAAMFGQTCLDCNPVRHSKATKAGVSKVKNLCGKTRPKSDPYEVWEGGGWRWEVLKKWQADDSKPYARWFCNVVTPMCPNGEMGDVYVADIKRHAVRVK